MAEHITSWPTMASASLPRSHTFTTLIKPTKKADNYALLPYETYAGTWAFPYAGYTPYVFYYEALDVEALKAALLEVLNHYPAFAGRINAAGSEIHYSSSNQGGVPFTVETLNEDAPQHVAECNESALLTLADVRCPHHVSAGSEPVATVKVTRYREGRAALGFCVSHAIADGTSTFAFLNAWAACARGEPLAATKRLMTDRTPFLSGAPPAAASHEAFEARYLEVFGVPLKPPMPAEDADALGKSMDGADEELLIRRSYQPPPRHQLLLSAADLKAIKEAATPDVGWVSTQEALAAFLLQNIGRLWAAERQADAKKPGLVRMWRNCRKALGLEARHVLGVGVFIQSIPVGEDYLAVPLPTLAVRVHDAYAGATDEDMRGQLYTFNELSTHSVAAFMPNIQTFMDKGGYDASLQLNNMSKFELPDFGSGSPSPRTFLTVAGPSVVVPAPEDGVAIYLEADIFPPGKEKPCEALLAAVKKLAERDEPSSATVGSKRQRE